MNKSICGKDHFDSKVINVFFEGLGFTSVCEICASSSLEKYISCKRYAETKYTTQCSSAASYFLEIKKGYYLPYCEQCCDDDDMAVAHVISEKYGRVKICNKYLKYIKGLNYIELNYMCLVATYPLKTKFIERHENPESEHYYMRFPYYHVDYLSYDPPSDDETFSVYDY